MYEVLTMNCIECKKKIKDFLNDSLNTRQTVDFVNHVNECPECMEELSVDFLVNEGLKRLDSATSFNLEEELKEKLEKSLKNARFSHRFSIIAVILTIVLSFLLGVFLSSFFAY